MMIHAKEVLVNQLLANADDPSWYKPLKQAVEGVTAEEALWKPAPESSSIAELVRHLLYWNDTWQLRYREQRIGAVASLEDNNESFALPDAVSFDELSGRLLETLLGWQELLSAEGLEARVEGFPVQALWWEIISNAATHNAYHVGQIMLIRKLYAASRS
jgi:uncharacterized damage-inducible protein DinB